YKIHIICFELDYMVSSNPELYSCKLRDGCLVVADRAVLLLDDICQSLRLFLQFESEVDVVGLCQEGQFLVIGERSGKLHLIHVSSEQTLLTNVCPIFSFSHLELKFTNEWMNECLLLQLQGQVETCFIPTEAYHTMGCLTALTMRVADKFTLIIGVNTSVVTVLPVVFFLRLSRLLHKRKFAEAESFAIHFGLDTELVYQVKLNSLLEGLPIESSGDVKASAYLMLVAQAKETLSKIKDSSFVVACCIRTPWPTYEIAQEMLDYAQSRVSFSLIWSLNKFDYIFSLVVDAFQSDPHFSVPCFHVWGVFLPTPNPCALSGTAWLEFLHNDDIFRDVLLQLKEGNLSSAQYIWLRHQADFEKSLDVKMLDQLLSTISAMVSRKVLCRWLGDVVIPFVRRFLPEGERRIAKWLEQSARNLELTDKANWPENGLEVAQVFFTSQSQGEVGLASSWHSVPLDEIKSLSDLVAALQGLLDLYRKYNCRLALSDFEKGDANTIVFRMFDKVPAAELIPVTLEKYIGPYICHHHLQKDEILLQYIKDLLQRYSKWSASLFDTMWEAKAIAVLGCMSDIDLIFDGVLAIMHGAVIPWSSGMKLLVEKYLHMDHAKVKLVQEGYQLMEMKTLLRSYGIRDTNLLNDKQMIWVIKYILKQDSPSCLEDVLKIANAYMLTTSEVYLWRIIDLIDKEKGDDVIDLLKSLPPSEAVEIAERTVTWGKLELEAEMFDSEEEVTTIKPIVFHSETSSNSVVSLLLVLILILCVDHLPRQPKPLFLTLMFFLPFVQANFDICVSPKDYENLSLMTQLLQEKIDSYNAERSQKTQEKTSVENGGVKRQKLAQCGLYRLAGLLRRTEPEMGTELALRALDAGNVEEALNICRDLYEHHHNEQTGKLLFLACRKICHVLASGGPLVVPKRVNLSTAIHEMAVQAVTVCSPDLLSDAMELSKYTSLARELSEKCQIEDTGFIAKTSLGADKDPFTEWTFDEFFTEDGAVLDPSTVLVIRCFLLNFHGKKPLQRHNILSPFSPLVAHNLCTSCMHPVSVLLSKLQEGSQCEFALKLAVISLGSLFQNVTASNVDMSLGAMVFNSHPIDHRLALGYCTVLPKEMRFQMLWDLVNKTAQNYSKIQVGLGSSFSLCGFQKEFEDLITDAEWGLELGKLGISFQSVFRMPSVRKKEFLATLVKHPNVETELIKKYCSAYQVDMDAALKFCIEMHFQNVSATGVEGDASGDTGKSPKHGVVLSKALETVPLLNSPASLVDNLSATLYKLDPYDYETIEALLLLIERAGVHTAQALMLLKHLKSYKRTSVPGALERQYIIGQGMALPPAAQTRLPFHMIFFGASNYFFKIIAAELSEDSFHKLLLMSKLMKVSLNTLYLLAADHLFQQKLKPKILDAMRSECWEAVDKETAKIVQTITSYLHCITNPKWATGLAYKMAEELPPGMESIRDCSLLEICLNLGLRHWWSDELREKAEESLKKLQVQHRHSATEAVLMVHKLNSEEHRKLLGAPGKLIVSLYQHSSIPESFQDPMGRDYPDVHAAAKEIAKINDLDMTTIWNVLLEKWLCPTEFGYEPRRMGQRWHQLLCFHRVIYLLQAHPEDSRLRILHRWTVSEISPVGLNQLSFAHRSRALKCLLYIADPPAVESLFKKPVENVKQFLKCLIYLAEFEVLNIPYTYESFHSTPKEGLVKGLWKNHSHKPMAVKLMTELSLDYQVHDAQLWNGLLQKLMSFQMISHLRKVLREISGICSLWQIPNFSRAWQTVICAPLLSGKLSSYFSFPKLCPLTTHLDLLGIAKQYVQLQLPAFAFGCLLLIPQLEKRSQVIQDLLAKCSLEAMAQQVDEYMSWGEVAGLASQVGTKDNATKLTHNPLIQPK
uniref:Kinetochore associated 1 n=1 Tax=Anolis carolinensis TaxID=28377 RepID=H9G5N1_ANOCA